MELPPIIAVDFDGTITAENDYHNFTMDAPLKRGCVEVLQKLKNKGAKIILYTCREGSDLEQAVEYCKLHNIPIDYVNENVPWLIEAWGNNSRKVYADYYVDDLAFDKTDFNLDWYDVEMYINYDMFFRCMNCAYYDGTICKKITEINNIYPTFYNIKDSIPTEVKPTHGCKRFTYSLKEAD